MNKQQRQVLAVVGLAVAGYGIYKVFIEHHSPSMFDRFMDRDRGGTRGPIGGGGRIFGSPIIRIPIHPTPVPIHTLPVGY